MILTELMFSFYMTYIQNLVNILVKTSLMRKTYISDLLGKEDTFL